MAARRVCSHTGHGIYLDCPTHTCRRTYVLLGFFFPFSPRILRARWTELNQNRPQCHGRKWVWLENACPKSGVSPPPTNRGPKNHFSSTTSQLNDNFSGLYLRNEMCYRQSVSALTTTRVSYIVSNQHELWPTNGFKVDRSFCPPYVYSAFYFIARLCTRASADGTQPNFAKRWTVNHANNLP